MDCFSWVRSRQLGAVNGKISKDCGPNDGGNVAVGVGGTPVAWRWLAAELSLRALRGIE
jgi:hypothetical protein